MKIRPLYKTTRWKSSHERPDPRPLLIPSGRLVITCNDSSEYVMQSNLSSIMLHPYFFLFLFSGFVVIHRWCDEHTKVGIHSTYANLLLLCPLIPVAVCNLTRTGMLVFVLNLGGTKMCGRKRQLWIITLVDPKEHDDWPMMTFKQIIWLWGRKRQQWLYHVVWSQRPHYSAWYTCCRTKHVWTQKETANNHVGWSQIPHCSVAALLRSWFSEHAGSSNNSNYITLFYPKDHNASSLIFSAGSLSVDGYPSFDSCLLVAHCWCTNLCSLPYMCPPLLIFPR